MALRAADLWSALFGPFVVWKLLRAQKRLMMALRAADLWSALFGPFVVWKLLRAQKRLMMAFGQRTCGPLCLGPSLSGNYFGPKTAFDGPSGSGPVARSVSPLVIWNVRRGRKTSNDGPSGSDPVARSVSAPFHSVSHS